MTTDYNITLRALTPEDWDIFRTMRICALKECPGVFLGKYEDAKNFPQEHWQETLDGQGKQVFGLFDNQELIGITAVFTWREDPSGETGVMAMSYIMPEYRGQGFSKLFYKARIEWAIHYRPFKKLAIGHREGNEPSRRAMLDHGFQYTGQDMIEWPDGVEDIEYNYELDLEKLRKQESGD